MSLRFLRIFIGRCRRGVRDFGAGRRDRDLSPSDKETSPAVTTRGLSSVPQRFPRNGGGVLGLAERITPMRPSRKVVTIEPV
jgi:hypothetical protein